jgi:acyl-CoA thioesterase YciA|tara:strand:- start:3454 stop:3840 length:387 start_codon:yes stop_codon:yes gene_type:complete
MRLITTRMVKEPDLGTHGNLFGGKLMSWIDEAGAVLSAEAIDSPRVVTVKFGELIFNRKVKLNRIVKIYGEVVKIGKTSITVNIESRRHNPYSGEQKLISRNELVFVKIDEDGDPETINDKIKNKYNK